MKRRMIVVVLLVLTFTFGVGHYVQSAAQQDDQFSGLVQTGAVDGIPLNRYRIPYTAGDCKVNVGVPEIVDPLDVLPKTKVDAPDAACPGSAGRTLVGGMMGAAWAVDTVIVEWLSQAVEWLFSFKVGEVLVTPVTVVAGRLNDRVVGPLELQWVALVVAALVGGWLLLTARIGKGLGVLLSAALLSGLITMVLVSPGRYFEETTGFGRDLSQVGLGLMGPAGSDNAAKDVGEEMRRQLVADQWPIHAYGHNLEGNCAEAAQRVLVDPKADAIKTMADAGCEREAQWASSVTAWRVISVLVGGLLTAVIAFMILRLALAVLWGQIALALLFAVSPLGLVFAIAPRLRRISMRWLSEVIEAVTTMVIAAVVLSVDVMILNALLTVPDWAPLARLTLAAMVATGFTLAFKRLVRRAAMITSGQIAPPRDPKAAHIAPAVAVGYALDARMKKAKHAVGSVATTVATTPVKAGAARTAQAVRHRFKPDNAETKDPARPRHEPKPGPKPDPHRRPAPAPTP